MNSAIENDEPCLVKAMQGFSVEYKKRLLYSKYAPEKNILHVIENTHIASGTLVLCVSPVLGLGLDALFAKLPENAVMLGIEADNTLFKFSKQHCIDLECVKNGAFTFLEPQNLRDFPLHLNSHLSKWRGVFKRVLRIDFSAGSSLHSDFYNAFYDAVQNSIAQFWKNRITLVKFGRRYSRNFFQNLQAFARSISLAQCGSVEELFGRIEKPLLVLGAGEGLESALSLPKSYLSQCFVLAVDAALPALQSLGIHIDAVVCEESQSVIAECFVGATHSATFAICSLSSCPRATIKAGKRCLFYTTLFDDLAFLENARTARILPPIVPPLGSVGLTAVFLATRFRRDETIPIATFGLDFSFSLGKTHARGTVQHIKRLCMQNKIHPLMNYGANFCKGAFFTADKNNKETTTTVALSGYARIFKDYFHGVKNLFDGATSGLTLGLELGLPKTNLASGGATTYSAYTPHATHMQHAPYTAQKEDELCKTENEDDRANSANGASIYSVATAVSATDVASADDTEKARTIHAYLEAEKNALQNLKDIFLGKIQLSQTERNEKIRALFFEREYLFFHFPDGIRPRLEQDFLNRVRAELDGFLKIFK